MGWLIGAIVAVVVVVIIVVVVAALLARKKGEGEGAGEGGGEGGGCGEGGDAGVGGGVQPCPPEEEPPEVKKIKVTGIEIRVVAPGDKLFMNDPEQKTEASAIVSWVETEDENDLDALPPDVTFSFSDPAPANTKEADSFNYGARALGKLDKADAEYWAAHAEHAATCTKGNNATAKVTLKPLGETKKSVAKVYFKSSGVGGDTFKVKVTISNGGAELAAAEGSSLTVWRSMKFDNIYEMQGETHVSTNATEAIICPAYNPAYVKYEVGPRTEIAAAKSVKYIGLWKDDATPQQSWATLQAKKADETPTADEITDAKYAGAEAALVTKRDEARTKIKEKAQKWADRIDAAFVTARNKWMTDAAIPNNALVAIKYYHPKYSSAGGDSATNEWKLGEAATPNWLKVGAFAKSGGGHYYTNLDPDGLWVNWAGLSHGSGKVTAPKGNAVATVKQVVRHEAGHATKSFFKRDVFGPSLDHSASNAGIMYETTAGGTTFTAREKKILRGIKP